MVLQECFQNASDSKWEKKVVKSHLQWYKFVNTYKKSIQKVRIYTNMLTQLYVDGLKTILRLKY